MIKKLILSIICTMAMLTTAGCSGKGSGTDPQQANNSASPAEPSTAQVRESIPVVYFTSDISAEGLVKIYDTLVECNTAYGGSRSSSAMHKQVAEDHGSYCTDRQLFPLRLRGRNADFCFLSEKGIFRF